MIKKITICLIIFSLIFILSAISFALELKCHDDGSISIHKSTIKKKVTAREKGTKDPYIDVPGKWQSYSVEDKTYYNFYSDEALFIVGKPTKFYIKNGKKLRRSVTCPTFKFSCKALNSTIESCYKRNDTFYAKFLIYNIPLRDKKHAFRFGNPFSLKYELHVPGGRKITHSPTEYSPEFKHIYMTLKKLKRGNKYTVVTDKIEQQIDKFTISSVCKKSIFYDNKECTKMPTCRYDGDCMEDEFCEGGICEKLDCEECQYTEKHKCASYDCCENSDCGNDEFCENNVCNKLSCKIEEEIIEHSCHLLNCASDEHTVNHECVRLECEEYEYALNRTCQLLRCDDDEHIVDHECEKLKCSFYQKAFDHDCVNYIQYIFAER